VLSSISLTALHSMVNIASDSLVIDINLSHLSHEEQPFSMCLARLGERQDWEACPGHQHPVVGMVGV